MENIEQKTGYVANDALSVLEQMPKFSKEAKENAEKNIAEAKSKLFSKEQEEEPSNTLLEIYENAKGNNGLGEGVELSDKNITEFLLTDYDACWNLEQSGYTCSMAEKTHIANIVINEFSDNSQMVDRLIYEFFSAPDDLKALIKEKEDFFTSYIQTEGVYLSNKLSSNDAFVELILRENRPDLIKYIDEYSPDGLKMLASHMGEGMKVPVYCGNTERLAGNLFKNKDEFDSSEFCELLTLLRDKDQYERKDRNGQSSFELLVGESMDYLTNAITEAKTIPKCLIKSETFRDGCINNNRFDLATKCILPPGFFENDELIKAYCSELKISAEDFNARKNWILNYRQKNNDIDNSLLGTSLRDGIFNLNKEHYERFINDSDFQVDVDKLNDLEMSVFSKILDNYDYQDFDTSIMVASIVNNIKDYNQLLDSVKPEQLSDDDLRQLVSVLQLPKNQYGINSLDDLRNYQALKEKYFADHFNDNSLNENKDGLVKTLFNIDLEEACYIDNKYCHSDINRSVLEHFKDSELPEDDYIRLVLINEIANCEDNSELANMFNHFRGGGVYDSEIPLEAHLRSEYSKCYSESLYKIDQHEQVYGPQDGIFEQIDYKGQPVKICFPREKLNLFLHAVGTCSLPEEVTEKNYAKDWLERPHLQDHFVACSYVDEKRINGIRSGGSVILGFDHLEGGALLGMGNTDIDSLCYSRTYDGSRKIQVLNGNRARFFLPSNIFDPKQDNYNEILIERRNNGKNRDEQIKRKPGYIIFVAESSEQANLNQMDNLYDGQLSFVADEDRKTIDRLQSKGEIKDCLKKYIDTIRQEAQNRGVRLNDLANTYVEQILKAKSFEESLRAASEFDIPLVIIDKSYYFNKMLQESGAYNAEEMANIYNAYINSDTLNRKNMYRAVVHGWSTAIIDAVIKKSGEIPKDW